MAGAAKGAAASSPVQVGMPGGSGAPGPSPVMPVPGAHTPSFQLRYRVPQAQLSLAHAGEARGEDMTLAREDGPHGPHSLVGRKPLLGGEGETGRGVTQLPALGELGGTSDRLADFGGGEPGRWDEGAGDRRGPNYSASSGGPRLAPRPGGSGRRAPLGRSRALRRARRRGPTAREVRRLPGVAARLLPVGSSSRRFRLLAHGPRPGRALVEPPKERARAQRGLAYRVPERELPLTHPAEAGAE